MERNKRRRTLKKGGKKQNIETLFLFPTRSRKEYRPFPIPRPDCCLSWAALKNTFRFNVNANILYIRALQIEFLCM